MKKYTYSSITRLSLIKHSFYICKNNKKKQKCREEKLKTKL